MSPRSGRISLKLLPWMSLAEEDDRPSDEISRISASPSVVLPEPDSPTTPSVCPSRTATSTPSTALMWPTVRRKKPRWIGNQTLRSSASITTGASRSAFGGLPFGSAARRCFV